MVYNEGFEFSFNNKEESYFVFLRYGENKDREKFKSSWVSYCHETLVGWFKTPKGWGCFHGIKDGAVKDEPTNGEANDKQIVTQNSIIPAYRFLGSEAEIQLTAQFKDHEKFVEKINAMGLSWKAENYEQFQGKTLGEINSMFRKGHSADVRNQITPIYIPTTKSFINKSLRPKPIYECQDLPKEFNYKDYMGPARQQVSYFK
jgi:hypothetical protein